MPPARRSRRDEPSSSESDSSSSDESSSSSSNSSSDSSSSSGSDSETTTSRSRTSGSTSATGTTTTTTTSRSTTSKTSTTPTSTSATSPSANSMKRRVSFMPTPLNDNRSGSDSSSGSDSTDDDDSTTETTSTTTASTSGTTTTTGTSATGDSRHGKSRRRPNEDDDDEDSSTSDEETQSETTTTTGTESTSATTSGTTTNTTTTHTSATTALTSATGSTIPRPRRPRNPKADKDETSSSSSSTTSSDEEDETETDDTTTTNDTSTRQTDVASPRDEFERALQAKALETELSVDLRGTKTLRAMEMSNSEPGTPAIPQISIPKPPPHRPGTTPAAVEQVKQSVEGFDSEQNTPVHQALPVPHPPPSRPIQAMGVGLEDDTDDGVAGGSETNESSGKGQLQEVEKNDENGRISTATLPPHGHPLDDSQADQPTVDDSIQNMGEDEDLPRIGTIESVGDAVRVMKPLRKPVVVGQAALLDVDEHPLASQMKDENVSMAIIVRDRAVNNAIDALESEASVYERRRESTATTPTPGSRRGSTTTGVVRNRYGDDADSADGGSSVKRPGGNGPSSQHHPNGSDDDGGSTIASSPDESFIDDASSSNVPTGRPGRRAATTPRPAPKKTITRYIRDTMGVSAQPSHVHYDPLPAWFMIEYASPQDYVAKLIRQQLDHQEQAEEGQADETRCPRNRLSKANAVMLLRAFELDDRKIKELTMTLGPHATLGDVQNLIEEETLTLTAKALEKAVHTADTYRSGELPSFQINKVLINSGIGNSDIGTNKVSVRLGMFKRSLGVSIQQLSDKPQFFDLVQSARFRVNSVPGSQNIIINDTYIVSNLTNSEREETMLALNAAVYIRKVIDQATMDDHSVEYGPVLRNLLCHPVGWSKSTAVANKRKSFFREKIVQWCLKPASKIEAIRNRSLPPFLLRTVAAKESHHFNFMPEIHIDRNEGTAHLEKTVEDLSKKHITIAINEVRLPGEEIPSGSTLYLLVSTISEGQEALPAVRLPCNPQTKPSDIWTFPKGRNSLIAYGNRTDIIYLEMCYDVKGEPRTAGFSSITLEKAKDGASALWVTGGTIYQQHRKRDTTEATKSCFCMTGPPPVHMLVEFSKVKATVLTHFNATVYPARFICEESHYALVGQCREAIFDRLSDSPHVLHVVRDIYVKKALSITEDATLMSVFSEIWNKHVKKFTKDHRKDPRYIRQQLLQLMNKVAAARNLVVDPQEIVKIISHDGRINLLPNAPLKPVHSEVSVSVGAKLLEGI